MYEPREDKENEKSRDMFFGNSLLYNLNNHFQCKKESSLLLQQIYEISKILFLVYLY